MAWPATAGAGRNQSGHHLADTIEVGAIPEQHLRSKAFALTDQSEQKAFGADPAMAEFQRLTQRQLQDFPGARRERDKLGLGLGPAAVPDELFDLLGYNIRRDAQRLQYISAASLDQAKQKMFGADVVVVECPGILVSQRDKPAAPDR